MGQPSSKQMGQSSSKAVTLYHYTDKEGKDAILESRFIMMSTDTRLDAILGIGVYMTSMSPFDNTREDIVDNNWRGLAFDSVVQKTHYVFQVKVKESNLKSHKEDDRDIYVFGLENLVLDLLEDWTLYEWTSDEPTKVKSGKFSVQKQYSGGAQYM